MTALVGVEVRRYLARRLNRLFAILALAIVVLAGVLVFVNTAEEPVDDRFLATDLTVRLLGKGPARQVIARVMIPALLASYVVSVLFQEGAFRGLAALGEYNEFVLRISVASFLAYVLGQLLDIQVFDRLRQLRQWWIAPTASTILGNLLDTFAFFSVAFWRSDNPFMASHWPEIALVDYGVKLTVSLLLFVPLYGVLLRSLVPQAWARRPDLA